VRWTLGLLAPCDHRYANGPGRRITTVALDDLLPAVTTMS
jgi:hypothetical protein